MNTYRQPIPYKCPSCGHISIHREDDYCNPVMCGDCGVDMEAQPLEVLTTEPYATLLEEAKVRWAEIAKAMDEEEAFQ